jgi:AbrB family looped-hinge helix DNA binding protein
MAKAKVSSVDKVRVSSKFQIVIPRGVRERQGIHPGQELFVLDQGLGVTLVPDIDIAKLRAASRRLS